jgi:hypothetical protein
MLLKVLILRSLPYVAGAGLFSMVADRDVSSLVLAASRPSSRTEMLFGQVVNRSRKGNKIMMPHDTHQVDDREHRPQLVPTLPKQEIKTACERPFDVSGRCFANALGKRHVQG